MAKEMDFEKALQKLEDIVEVLETEKLSLDDSLKKFEEGMALSKLCNKKLEEAKRKVEKLVSANGDLKTEPFS